MNHNDFESLGIGGKFRRALKEMGYQQPTPIQTKAIPHLLRKADVLVATPGRLLDLAGQRHVDLSEVSVLVLDEADRLLDMGFIRDVKRIVAQTPGWRQSLLFSATMPTEVVVQLSPQDSVEPAASLHRQIRMPLPTVRDKSAATAAEAGGKQRRKVLGRSENDQKSAGRRRVRRKSRRRAA